MSSRKETRALAKQNVESRKAVAEAEIAALPEAERAAATKVAKATARAERKARKAEAKALPRAERKDATRLLKAEKKYRTRVRRRVTWGVVGLVVVGLGIVLAPIVGDIRALFSIELDSETPEGVAARAAGNALSEQIADEGIVLLKNEGGTLPLAEGGVNVFGFASMNLRFGGGGSGTADQSQAVNLYDALELEGLTANPALYDALIEAGAEPVEGNSSGLIEVISAFIGGGAIDDVDPGYLTDELMTEATAYSDTALVVFGNDGVEAQDFTVEQLRLTDHQHELLDRIAEYFDEIVVIINSGNTMELGFLDEPEITAAISMGTPGPRGGVSLAKILTGEVNPSGRLTDTFAYDAGSAPATVNFGSFQYENANRAFQNYSEGIYVGYRYYETRYEGDPAGYAAAVQYPFGYGLSYTDFEWEVTAPAEGSDEFEVSVEVTNTGSVAGKDVVQLYFSAPYTEGGIEKSAIELGGFAKTSLLQPGESETVEITLPIRGMASWDLNNGNYVIEAGSYSLLVGTNVHDTAEVRSFEIPEAIVYTEDETTGVALENRFADAAGDITYLSRADWDGTFPSVDTTDFVAPDDVVAAISASPVPTTDLAEGPTLGAENGVVLADLAGLDYDDPQWQEFLDQFTLDELKELFSRGGYRTIAIDRLGIPASVLLDGPAGISFFFGDVTAAAYPTAVVIAQTWNVDLAQQMGEAVGTEANAYGLTGWYAPGMNIHRTPLGGRNFEYYSEDPLLAGKMAAGIVAGAESKNVTTFMKHFVLNEQETHARTGINIWANEQSMREIWFRPFEITAKEGGGTGVMSSFVHVGTTWSGGNEALLEDLLRGEWGFRGMVTTDAVLGSFMDIRAAALYGNDLMLSPVPSMNDSRLNAAIKEAPNAMTAGLRERAHNICYTLLQTELIN